MSTNDNALTIHESAEFVRIIFNNNPEDWIAEYRKEGGFPARRWAERAVAMYDKHQSEQTNG